MGDTAVTGIGVGELAGVLLDIGEDGLGIREFVVLSGNCQIEGICGDPGDRDQVVHRVGGFAASGAVDSRGREAEQDVATVRRLRDKSGGADDAGGAAGFVDYQGSAKVFLQVGLDKAHLDIGVAASIEGDSDRNDFREFHLWSCTRVTRSVCAGSGVGTGASAGGGAGVIATGASCEREEHGERQNGRNKLFHIKFLLKTT